MKWTEAESLLRECLLIRAKVLPDDWLRFNSISQLGGALLGLGRFAEAEPLLVEGYEGMKSREARIPPPSKVRLHEAGTRLVQLYEARGNLEKANEWRNRLGHVMSELPDDVFAPPAARGFAQGRE